MTHCPLCNGPVAPAALSADAEKVIASKSTATEAQTAKLAALLEIRPHHTYELRRLGISHPAGRVQDLEEEGYQVHSDRVTVVDENAFSHHGVAIYSLLSKPDAKQAQEAPGTALEATGGAGVAC